MRAFCKRRTWKNMTWWAARTETNITSGSEKWQNKRCGIHFWVCLWDQSLGPDAGRRDYFSLAGGVFCATLTSYFYGGGGYHQHAYCVKVTTLCRCWTLFCDRSEKPHRRGYENKFVAKIRSKADRDHECGSGVLAVGTHDHFLAKLGNEFSCKAFYGFWDLWEAARHQKFCFYIIPIKLYCFVAWSDCWHHFWSHYVLRFLIVFIERRCILLCVSAVRL